MRSGRGELIPLGELVYCGSVIEATWRIPPRAFPAPLARSGPTNSLACLYGLTEDVRQRHVLGEVDLRIHVMDEAVNRTLLDRIFRLNRRAARVCWSAWWESQTDQFCRAADIALALRRKQVAVMIGGFHLGGLLAMFPTVSPEIQQLADAGVSVVAGEVEHR